MRQCTRGRFGVIWPWFHGQGECAGGGPEDAAREDRRADAGERFFVRCARQGRAVERKAMIDRDHELPLVRQAELLRRSRGSLYYHPAIWRSCAGLTNCTSI